MSLRLGTLVKIVGERGWNWNQSGLMDKYKGKWGIIISKLRGERGYAVRPLIYSAPSAELDGMEDWQWLEEDFEVTELHCPRCGNLTTDEELNSHMEMCATCFSNMSRGRQPLEITENIVNSSTVLPENS